MKKLSFRLPLPGGRIIRSVAAIALCFAIYELRGRQGIPFYTAIAALQCIQPYRSSTLNMGRKRITGTFVGAFWGLVVLLICVVALKINGTALYYIIVSLFTGVVIYSTVVLGVKDTAYFSAVVFLSIVINHIGDENPYVFVLNRVVDTLIGIALAMLVNGFRLPRRKVTDTLFVTGIDATLIQTNSGMSPYALIELNRMIDNGIKFTVSTYRTPASVREALPGVRFPLPIIAMGGAVLYDMNENRYLVKRAMSREKAERVQAYLNERGVGFFANTIKQDLLIIYYDKEKLTDELMKSLLVTLRKSPYRNYIHRAEPALDDVIYLFIELPTERAKELYEDFAAQSWAADYKIVLSDSIHKDTYSAIKIYDCSVSREAMIEELCTRLNVEKHIVFGSFEGECDILIRDPSHDKLVHALKKEFEPLYL